MSGLPDLEGWRTYPRNLPLRGCTTYGYDCDAYAEQLERDAERLFVSGQNIHLKVIELRSQDQCEQILTKPDELNHYLKCLRPSGVIRVILVPQDSSWGSLRITQECMLTLLTNLEVFPACVNILRAFGRKVAVEDESYGGFYIQKSKEAHYVECAYTVKYPEEHGREGPSDPWSLRQMGIYHQSYNDGDSTFIILNPSISFLRRLKQAMASEETLTPWMIQMMVLSAAMENWRWYISELEKRFTLKKTNTQLSSINKQKPGELHADITFEDTQDIQVLQDKLSQSLHHLTTNNEVINQIRVKRAMIAGEKNEPEEHFIGTLMVEASMELNRVKSILKRAEGIQALAQSILDFTCLENLQSNSRTMTELTKLSQEEAEMLLELTMKASRDTDILKTLTMLTLIYLPASLISSIMGMDYINVVNKGSKISIEIREEMWIFLVLAVILLIATLGSYYVWLRNKRAKRHKMLKRSNWRKRTVTW